MMIIKITELKEDRCDTYRSKVSTEMSGIAIRIVCTFYTLKNADAPVEAVLKLSSFNRKEIENLPLGLPNLEHPRDARTGIW